MHDTDSRTGSRAANRNRFYQRHPLIAWGVVLAILLPLLAVGGHLWYLNAQFGNIGKVDTSALGDRDNVDDGKDLNILLIGSDKGEAQPGQSKNTTLAEDAAASEWPTGKYRSDTLMVIHIPADRSQVYLVSIPRDSFVPIHDANGNTDHSEKINAAFSSGGPIGTMSTVENLTGLEINHLVIIDWDGFRDLSRAVGGVPVTIPKTFYDPQQKILWEEGDHILKGNRALQYVRTRYGLIGGDFDRIRRQQNFMRALMGKMLDQGVTSNPAKLTRTVSALSRNITVDEGWTKGAMVKLALAMRGLETDDVTFLTAPVAGTETIPVWGSIVRLDEAKSAELFTALKNGTMAEYLAKYPDDALDDEVA